MAWSPHFDTGFPEIDTQHRKLVAEINELARQLSRGDTPMLIERRIARLVKYAKLHFLTEEAMWASRLAGDAALAAHRRHHAEFLPGLLELRTRVRGLSNDEGADALLDFLVRWLAAHILKEDHLLARIWLAVGEGASVAEATRRAEAAMAGPAGSLVDGLLALNASMAQRTRHLLNERTRRERAEKILHDARIEEAALRQQRDMRQLINELAADLMPAASGDLGIAVDHLLKRSGEYFGADRAYVFLFHEDRRMMSNSHEWCAPGVLPQRETLQNIEVGGTPWWWDQIARTGQVLIPDVALLPPEAEAERAVLEPQGIRSLCAFPLQHADRIYGFVGFDAVREQRDWGCEVLDFGAAIGGLIGIALVHANSVRALRESEAKLRLSEERFRDLVETNSDCTWEVDPGGRYTYLSPQVQEQLGYGPEEILGKLPTEVPFWTDARQGAAVLDQYWAGTSFNALRHTARHRSGRLVIAESSGIPIYGPQGHYRGMRGITRDVTERVREEESLLAVREAAARQAGELRLGALVEQGLAGVAEIDLDGHITHVNTRYCEIVGHAASWLIGRHLNELMPDDDWALNRLLLERLHASGGSLMAEKRFRGADGSLTHAQVAFALLRDPAGPVSGYLALVTDITARKRAELALQERTRLLSAANAEQQALFDTATIGIAFAVDRVIHRCNRTLETLLGCAPGELIGQTLCTFFPDEVSYQASAERLRETLAEQGYFCEEVEMIRKDASRIWVRLAAAPIDPDVLDHGVAVTFQDVTIERAAIEHLHQLNADLERKVEERTAELRRLNQQLHRLAAVDTLTGLWNRRHGKQVATTEIMRAERYAIPVSLALFDIDHFKRINDRYGHLQGDEILKEFAARIRRHLRELDVLVRWGGEEFLLLMPNTEVDAAVRVAEKLRALLARTPFSEVGQVTASFGVAQLRAGEDSFDAWLKRADDALYRAKSAGRNRVRMADEAEQFGV